MSAKHTPGPWKVGKRIESGSGPTRRLVYFTIDGQGGPVSGTSVYCGKVSGATVTISEEACDANARLIAAAPDLVEALRNLIDACRENRFKCPAVTEAKQALTKAGVR